LNNNHYFVESNDGQEVSIDLGIYIAKMMMNRLTEREMDKFQYKNNQLLEKSKSRVVKKNSKDMKDMKDMKDISLKDRGVLDKSIKNIIYDEINKGIGNNNNINASIIQNQGPQNSIIFTNISNLQVNIATNMRRSSSQDKSKNSDEAVVEKEREKSKKSKKKKKEKKKRQSRSKSVESYHSDATLVLDKNDKNDGKKIENEKSFEKTEKNNRGKKYDKFEIVERNYQPSNYNNLKRKRSRSRTKSKSPKKAQTKTLCKEDFISKKPNNFHNKLFSKAMQNVAQSFLKNDQKRSISNNNLK